VSVCPSARPSCKLGSARRRPRVIKSLASCLSVCPSVRAPTVAILFNFDEILYRGWGPRCKKAFVMARNPMTHSPILPKFFTLVMYFQWESPNTAVTRLVDRLWERLGLYAESCLAPILPLNTKMTINAFSMGICLAKWLTRNVSATNDARTDRVMVSKDPLWEPAYCESK